MKTVSVVVGANYGDEGKGLTTNYLAKQRQNSIVVRFNSSAQAGHTVEMPDGRRHVFSHIGSGSFAGAATFLSPFFVVSPMFFRKEIKELRSKGCEPRMMADPSCLMVTPYDVMLNQAIEDDRNKYRVRHGSCGMGFGEAIERSAESPMRVCYGDKAEDIAEKLNWMRSEYVPRRLKRFKIEKERLPHLENDGIIERYIDDFKFMREAVGCRAWHHIKGFNFDHVIFEGAQGLSLDMDSPDFPHVTRSKTGVYNVVRSLIDKAGLTENTLEIFYITRTYLTRHGAGPLEEEYAPGKLPFSKIVDKTNAPNEYQGSLRFAPLDLDRLIKNIEEDRLLAKQSKVPYTTSLMMTCCDQSAGEVIGCLSGRTPDHPLKCGLFLDNMLSYLKNRLSLNDVLTSWGPTEDTIRIWKPGLDELNNS